MTGSGGCAIKGEASEARKQRREIMPVRISKPGSTQYNLGQGMHSLARLRVAFLWLAINVMAWPARDTYCAADCRTMIRLMENQGEVIRNIVG